LSGHHRDHPTTLPLGTIAAARDALNVSRIYTYHVLL
jgi:hypothetical protein